MRRITLLLLFNLLIIYLIINTSTYPYQDIIIYDNTAHAFLEPHNYTRTNQTVASDTWDIFNTVVIKNQTLVVNRSIFIHNGGALILQSSRIEMNLSYSGELWIEVFSGGNLTITDSTITALNKTNRYYIKINNGAMVYIADSEISYAGYSLEGAGEKSGLWINTSNVVITRSRISHNLCGIYLVNSYSSIISENLLTNNNITAKIVHSSNNFIMNNIIFNNILRGISLYESHENVISNNIISNCTNVVYILDVSVAGLFLRRSHYNWITNNTISDNFGGLHMEYSNNNSIINNRVINNRGGGIGLSLCTNNLVLNNTVGSNKGGIWLDRSKNNTLMNNTIFNSTFLDGIFISESYNNIVTKNVILDNAYGIYSEYSQRNKFTKNLLANNTCGICFYISDKNHVLGNTITSNTNATRSIYTRRTPLDTNRPPLPKDLQNKTLGILICYGIDNVIMNNTIANTTYGVYLYDAYSNAIFKNAITSCEYGIFSDNSKNNHLIANTFANNTHNTWIVLSLLEYILIALAVVTVLLTCFYKKIKRHQS